VLSVRVRLLACATLLVACSRDASRSTSRAAPGDALPARPVRLVPVVEGTLLRTVGVNGTLAADEQAVVGFKVPGRLGSIRVDLGFRVRKGDELARLDPTDYDLRAKQAEAALHQARARSGLSLEGDDDRFDPEQTALVRAAIAVLEEARMRLDRQKSMWEQKLIGDAELEPVVMAFKVAETRHQDAREEVRTRQAVVVQRRSELASARQQLTDTVLLAPFDGAVRTRHASFGEYLTVGAPVVTLVRMHPLRLRLPVPELESAGVHEGQDVSLGVEGVPGTFHGRIVRLSPVVEEGNRTLLVEAEVPNDTGILRPGAFARASIVTAPDTVLLVPATAVVSFAGIDKLLQVKEGRVVERRVQTGRTAGEQVEVVEGVAAGDQVIAVPGNLVTGQPVTVGQ
jgi:RND family efflux transporter MFP subunit